MPLPMTTTMTTTTMQLKRPTPSTLEEWETFSTVNDDKAQIRLARAMGYPPSWRVVRNLIQVPIPESLAQRYIASGCNAVSTPTTTDNDGTGDRKLHMITTVQDRIYAGDPASQPDGYYNHTAALIASSKMPWRPEYDDVIHDNNDDDYDDDEYCSTSHRNKGGQLKPREAKFEEGDIVEVLYDEDEEEEPQWFEATILRKVEYQDDIRYDVHYTVDDAIQSDVREMKIRATNKTKKKKQQQHQKKKAAASKKSTPKKQSGGSTPKKQSGGNKKRGGGSNVKSPPSKKKRGRPAGSSSAGKKKGKVVVEEESPVVNDFSLDEGDPPWRISGHKYISRKIKWKQEPDEPESIGTVVGWISETDVDSEGNPGFVSSTTDEPAKLFHAVFEEFEQDFEEWELEECLL